jgi:hypothetical protein
VEAAAVAVDEPARRMRHELAERRHAVLERHPTREPRSATARQVSAVVARAEPTEGRTRGRRSASSASTAREWIEVETTHTGGGRMNSQARAKESAGGAR